MLPSPLASGARSLRDRAGLLLARSLEMRLRRSREPVGAALVFHGVAERDGDRALEIEPAIGRDRLEMIAAYLRRRYRLVHASELLGAAGARRPGEPLPVALTFDDDLDSHRSQAVPALARHGATATAFLCGRERPFWWQLLQDAIDTDAIESEALAPVPAKLVGAALNRRPRAIRELASAIESLPVDERARLGNVLADSVPGPAPLGAEGVAELAAAGWEIGAHTSGHDPLPALDDAGLEGALERRPIAGSGEGPPDVLAYPHGKAGEREAAAARNAGYRAAFTGNPRPVGSETDPFLVGRLQPDTATLGRFALDLARSLRAA